MFLTRLDVVCSPRVSYVACFVPRVAVMGDGVDLKVVGPGGKFLGHEQCCLQKELRCLFWDSGLFCEENGLKTWVIPSQSHSIFPFQIFILPTMCAEPPGVRPHAMLLGLSASKIVSYINIFSL